MVERIKRGKRVEGDLVRIFNNYDDGLILSKFHRIEDGDFAHRTGCGLLFMRLLRIMPISRTWWRG
jgi:hypothetical protein